MENLKYIDNFLCTNNLPKLRHEQVKEKYNKEHNYCSNNDPSNKEKPRTGGIPC